MFAPFPPYKPTAKAAGICIVYICVLFVKQKSAHVGRRVTATTPATLGRCVTEWMMTENVGTIVMVNKCCAVMATTDTSGASNSHPGKYLNICIYSNH